MVHQIANDAPKQTVFATYREWIYTFETDFYLILRSMLRLFYVIEKKMFLSLKQVGTNILWAIFNNNNKKTWKKKQKNKKRGELQVAYAWYCMISPVLPKQREISRDFECLISFRRFCRNLSQMIYHLNDF